MKKSATKAPAKSSTAVTTQKATGPSAVSTNVINFAEDAGKGLEQTDKSSFAIPFLIMLQGLSPQLETVQGAKPGLIMNTITNELFESVLVVPCYYQRRFIRWAPRSAGGGYKGELLPADVETNKVPGMSLVNNVYLMDVPAGANPFDKDGRPIFDHLMDTRNHFVLFKSASGNWSPALLSLSSTQIKKSKRWMSRISGIEIPDPSNPKKTLNPPMFSHIYTLTPVKEKNARGEWWGFDIDIKQQIDDINLYHAAKTFYNSVGAGKVEVAPPAPPADAGDAPTDDSRF